MTIDRCEHFPNRHATAHVHATRHPVVASFERGEQWGYCYTDEAFFERLPSGFRIVRRGA